MTHSEKHNPGIVSYSSLSYDTRQRFASYWHQIAEIMSLLPERVLEIGVGSGFVSTYLRNQNLPLTTLDTSCDLKPQIVGDVTQIPCADSSFDVVSCCEVLEHLPYELFPTALSEIHRVSRRYAIVSLPDAGRVYRLALQVPMVPDKSLLYRFARFFKRSIDPDGLHCWEIGRKGYPLRMVVHDLQSAGFSIEKAYNVFENPLHRFFVLRRVVN